MYTPMVAIDVASERATELPRLGSPRQKLRKHASHTVDSPASVVHPVREGESVMKKGRLTSANRNLSFVVDNAKETVSR